MVHLSTADVSAANTHEGVEYQGIQASSEAEGVVFGAAASD
jgi:hypothetical protein